MYFKVKNYNLYYEKHGNKKDTIIILPGWGEVRKTFYPMIEKLKKDYTVYIIDYPGFGYSPIINKELTVYDYSFIIYSFINHIKVNNPTIIAHSFGGRITSLLISEYKLKINKIILIDVAGIKRLNPFMIIKKYTYKLLKLLTIFFPKTKRYYIRKKLFNKFSSSDYKTIPQCMKTTFKNIIKVNLKKHYKRINNKTLIIWGDKDKDTPIKDAYTLNKIIKKSKLLIYKNSSHFSYLDNKEDIYQKINEFIKKEN